MEAAFGVSVAMLFEHGLKALLDKVDRLDKSRLEDAFKCLFVDGRPLDLEYRVIRSNGSVAWVKDQAYWLTRSTGERIVMGMLTDITEQRLRDERATRLASVVDSCDQAMIALGTDGAITDWNKGAARLYGYRPEEIIGRPFSVIVPSGRECEVQSTIERIVRGLWSHPMRHSDSRRMARFETCQ